MYSAEELQKPPIIDLEEFLQPISEENPSGENLRYSGLYDEILAARYEDEDLALGNLGQWKYDLKAADYRKVIELASNALKTQTKDLQIAVWFSEALAKVHGFVGLRDSLKLVSGLQENFWETLHPEIDEGDMEARANALAFLDKQMASTIKEKPITEGEGLIWLNWEESTRFDIPDSLDGIEYNERQRLEELKKQAETENRVTGEKWRRAKAVTRRAFCEETYFVLSECWTEYENLNRIIEEKFDRNQAPGLNLLKKSLDDVQTQVKRLLDEKRLEEPDPEDEQVEADQTEVVESEDGTVMAAVAGKKGPIQNRQDALKRLSEVAEYFRKNEPHSPVSYLIHRAVKWGNMPLENWLQDVIKDESIISNLRQTLGFNTGSGDEESSAQ